MLLSDPPPIVMCDFDSRTARWGLDVPATLLARADEIMNAECPLSGVKRTWLPQRKMSAYDPKRPWARRLMSVSSAPRLLQRPPRVQPWNQFTPCALQATEPSARVCFNAEPGTHVDHAFYA